MGNTVVQFSPHTPVGDTLHRRAWPMQALGALPDFSVIDVHNLSPYRYWLSLHADLLIVDTTLDPEFIPILRWRKSQGRPTVFEVHNHIFDAEPWNPEFPVSNDPATQEECIQMMGLANMVQTTTAFLADAFRPHSARVVAFPNQLPDAPDTLPGKPESPLVIGWGGSATHICDMAEIAPSVASWVTYHDGVVLAVMGAREVANLFKVPPEKLRFVPAGDMTAYHKFLQDVHIGLAPLRDTPFNRARSDVKWLEYAVNGCVFVGQRLPTYDQSIADGKTGFLFGDPDELIRTLDSLCDRRELLDEVRHAAFRHVTRTRMHSQHAGERAAVYRELLTGVSPQADGPGDLDARCTFPRPALPDPLPDYLPLTLSPEAERALIQIHSPAPSLDPAAIALLEQRYPGSHLLCQAKARNAMAQRDAHAAEQHLRESLSLYPGAVRSLVLLGRVLGGMGRIDEARKTFTEAVEWNPWLGAAYRFLLSIAEQQADWQTAVSVTENWERNCHWTAAPRARRGLVLIRSGDTAAGIQVMDETLDTVADQFRDWQRPYAADLVGVLRQAHPLVVTQASWSELLLRAADLFPHSLWLATRAGEICFQRQEYERGARILRQAREHLLAVEWHGREGGHPHEHRQFIELYRTACEEQREAPN